jgi:hypothetical protein
MQLEGQARQGCLKRTPKGFKHGCLKSTTLSRYARMHKDSHTKPLHDATAQMAVDAVTATLMADEAQMQNSGHTQTLALRKARGIVRM